MFDMAPCRVNLTEQWESSTTPMKKMCQSLSPDRNRLLISDLIALLCHFLLGDWMAKRRKCLRSMTLKVCSNLNGSMK